MPPKLIFIEGLPGAGKTTFINWLRSNIICLLAPRPAIPTKSNHTEFNINLLNTLYTAKLNVPIIFDRFCWSDVIFSTVIRKDCSVDIRPVLNLIEKFPHAIVWFNTSAETSFSRQTHSNFSGSELKEIEVMYGKLFRSTNNLIISNLFDDKYILEQIKTILGGLE